MSLRAEEKLILVAIKEWRIQGKEDVEPRLANEDDARAIWKGLAKMGLGFPLVFPASFSREEVHSIADRLKAAGRLERVYGNLSEYIEPVDPKDRVPSDDVDYVFQRWMNGKENGEHWVFLRSTGEMV